MTFDQWWLSLPEDLRRAYADGVHGCQAAFEAGVKVVQAQPYSLNLDPAGIRALTADAITGALAFGYQGVNPPPDSNHWLAPFWTIGRESAANAQQPVSGADVLDRHNLKTSAGGRGYVAEYFSKRLGRHDFTRYINDKLAADFACALAQHLRQQDADKVDAERLDWLRDNSCDLRCINVHTGGDDAEVHWIVVEHHMAKPHEREIGRAFTDDPRAAIDAARKEQNNA